MDEVRLVTALAGTLGRLLASELVTEFVKLRRDYSTETLERASAGKFVEALVQCLQFMATGKYDSKPDVDGYLSRKIEGYTTLPEGLRICAARAARLIYTLRNKRNIAHKNPVDPNRFDLALAHQAASWIMAELLREANGCSMAEAGALIEELQAPVGKAVELIDGRTLVHGELSVKDELLILLHAHHPDGVSQDHIFGSMSSRSKGSIKNRLGELRAAKFVVGDATKGFRLSSAGYAAAERAILSLQL